MSATITSEKKFVRDSAEDELSTSAGSSDNEVVTTSGDDEPPPPSMLKSGQDATGRTSCMDGPHSKKGFAAEMLCLTVSTLLEFCAFFFARIFGTKRQQPVRSQPSARLACRQPALRKTGRTVLVPSKGAKGSGQQCKQKNAVAPPPGLSLRHAGHPKVQSQHSPIQEIGPPPGLEAFSCPPGFQPLSQGQASAAPASPPGQWKAAASAHLAASKGVRKPPPPIGAAPEASDRGRPRRPYGPYNQPAPPQVPAPLPPPPVLREFDQAVYRKELSDVLRDLGNGENVAACIQRIRAQNVPKDKQAAEFSDILTRAAEETRGVARRLSFAFTVGLAISAFDHEECERGLEFFFLMVFDDLAAEVPRLRSKLAHELGPTLRTAFSTEQLAKLVPPDCRPVLC